MVVVGLTGGIGSGKSTVATLFASRGAIVVDADLVARQVMAPGGSAHALVFERFGSTVLTDGVFDRRALASIVFGDEAARQDLNRIVHPAVRQEMLLQVQAAGTVDPGATVVLDIPLLAESGRDHYPLAGVLVVDAPIEVAVGRLLASRRMTEADAWARVAAQATREERWAIADLVVDNSGDLDHLRTEVDRAWTWIRSLPNPRS